MLSRIVRVGSAVLVVAAFSPTNAVAQRRGVDQAAADAVKAKYRKIEVRIPMRDGAKLFTSIYVPRDTTHAVPFIMDRTPYGVAPYGPDAYRASLGPSGNPKFAESGFVFVYQDARGRFYSEGAYTEMTPHKESVAAARRPGGRSAEGRSSDDNDAVDESTDSYDT